MTLVLTLERAPHPQAVRQMTLETGELVIGRGGDADWRIDDPDLFVSRAHCRIVGRPGAYVVTDTSSGGLYVDEARNPLGSGNSLTLADGMRLRFGDFVVKVALADERAALRAPEAAPVVAAAELRSRVATRGEAASSFSDDDFFAPRARPEPAPPRPAALPDPFEAPVAGAWNRAAEAPSRPPSAAFDDPFSLDPVPTRVEPAAPPSLPPAPVVRVEAPRAPEVSPAPAPPISPPAPTPAVTASVVTVHVVPEPPRPAAAPAAPVAGIRDGADLHAALIRGLGLDPTDFPAGDPVAAMEAFGREYRLMVEGYMHLLRKRAEEKNNARIVRTTVGSADVNPLKFMPTPEAVLDGFAGGAAPGFLGAEAAIAGAIRDLAHHHVSAWRGVQAALGRMIDRFDPAALEEELKSRSTLETLLAGGRKAKLWELYEQRYREIARSAEADFLGEVGADFRDAYEEEE